MGTRFLNRIVDISAYDGDGGAITFLLRDDFPVDEAAPIASPRVCDPGPGQLTITDTGNLLSIGAGVLETGIGAVSFSDPYLVSAPITRSNGVLGYFKWRRDSVVTSQIRFGLSTSNSNILASGHIVNLDDDNYMHSPDNLILFQYSAPAIYESAIILRSTGCFNLVKGVTFAEWTIVWVTDDTAITPLYLVANNYENSGEFDTARVAELSSPWSVDDGVATDKIASPDVSDLYTHEADCLIEFTVDTLATMGQEQFHFRAVDGGNYWQVALNFNNSIALHEVVDSSPTIRGSANSAVHDGSRIVILCDDEAITIFSDVPEFVYSNAANFKTETAGKLSRLGTDGVVSDLITWPRVLSGKALEELEKYTQ